MRIALLEDDDLQARQLLQWLGEAGHNCQHYLRGADLMRHAGRESFDAILIDWMLPDINGDRVLSWVRRNLSPQIAVLFITGRSAETDIVAALDAGADDYLIKPLRRAELIARLNAALRRLGLRDPKAEVIEVGGVRLDPAGHQVIVNGDPVELTNKEFEVAHFLFANLGRLLSRGHIFEAVWGRSADVPTRTLDTHMSRVRSKLRLGAESGFRLVPVYSYGYRLERVTAETE